MSQYLLRLFWIAFPGAIMSCVLIPAASAQSAAPNISSGAPQDWSNRHLIHANPDTREEATRKGTLAFEQWKQMYEDPRFAQQVARKARFVQPTQDSPFSPQQLQWYKRNDRNPPAAASEVHRDWSYIMGFTAGSSASGLFPAKFSFDINAAPDCTNDFVVHSTNGAGANFAAGTAGSKSGVFTGQPNNGQTVTIAGTGNRPSLVLTASTTVNTGLAFQIGATLTATAANLAAAINRNGSAVGVTASVSGAQVTVTAIGPGTSGISVAEGLANFTWTGGNGALIGASGAAGQATILAFNNLYSPCGATYPLAYWSYNTGTGAVANGSPVISYDASGSQVAFIQVSANVASLVVLKWKAADGGVITPTSLTSDNNYPSCTAPCMKVIAFGNGANNTNSDPYVDYANNTLYVGDDAGVLHKFTGVFNGTPTEVTASPWPRTVSAGNKLSAPVYDSQSGLIFVGSAAGAATGGQLHSINATDGTLVSSARLSTTTSGGVADAPILDWSAQRVYVFVGSDTGTANATYCSASPCMAVYQFDTGFAANTSGRNKQQVGRGRDTVTTRQLYGGSFDNTYYTSADSANPSGNLYVCGSRSNSAQRPTIWRVQISNNAMTGANEGFRVSNSNSDCSPVTMITNGSSEYVYLGVTAGGNIGTCSGACLYMWDLNNLVSAFGTGTPPNASLPASGGTGGIIVDNISATAGASQIYYSTIASPGNAVQASQAGLQ